MTDTRNVRICGVNERNVIVPIIPPQPQALFHELCHAFHDISGTRKESGDTRTLEHLYHGNNEKIYWWKGNRNSDEEFYNITGVYSYKKGEVVFDPINCNMYDIYDAYIKHQDGIQRIMSTSYEEYIGYASEPYMRILLADTQAILKYPLRYFY